MISFYLNYFFKNPVSKYSQLYSEVLGVRTATHQFGGGGGGTQLSP